MKTIQSGDMQSKEKAQKEMQKRMTLLEGQLKNTGE
jgi:hypothetical protein